MVLFWVGNCNVKKAKNATLLCKPDTLRLGEGQVSTFWLMSLCLGEGKLCLSEGLHLGEGLSCLREPETRLLTISFFA